MKKFIVPIVMLMLVSFTGVDAELTKAEKKMAVTELKKTQKRLLNAIKGLSEAQLNFKSSPESWSIAECVEHLAIAENNIFGMLETALKTPADPSRRSEVQVADEKILVMIADRTNKFKAPAPFEPSGKFGSYEATVNEFKTKRAAHIKYIKKTKDDLRNRYQKLPFGTVDGLQIVLFMSGHTERHVKQIEEVMAHQNFPAK